MKGPENRSNSAPAAVATTARLHLRPFFASDAAALFRLNSDPEVMRYTGDLAFTSVSAAAEFIGNYDAYRLHGFGRWAVTLKSSGDFIGFCGLARDEHGEVDLGFRFYRDCWAMGYATEAGRAALSLGFGKLGLETIVGRALRENLPSVSVLQKLGMQFSDVSERNGLMWLVYAIDKSQFTALSDQA